MGQTVDNLYIRTFAETLTIPTTWLKAALTTLNKEGIQVALPYQVIKNNA